MKKIVDETKKIAGLEKMDLYLSDEELLKQDQEYYFNQGIHKNQQEIVFNMLKKSYSLKEIAECTNLSLEEIKRIIKDEGI